MGWFVPEVGMMDTRIATFVSFLAYGLVFAWVMISLFHPAAISIW